MATYNYMTLANLQEYDQLIKQYIGTEDAKSIKSISVSGNTVSFYKTSDGSGTAYATIEIPDVSGFMSKIASATGGKIVTSTATGEVAESGTAIADLATNAFVGSLPQGAESTTVVDYIGEAIEDAADDYMPKGSNWDGDKVVTSNSNGTVSENNFDLSGDCTNDVNIVTGYFSDPNEGDLITYVGSGMTISNSGIAINDVSDSIAATTGFDGDNTIADFIGSIPQASSATDVIGYVDEQVADLENSLGTAASADVATTPITEQSSDDSVVTAAQVSAFVASEIAGLEGAMHFRGVITRQSGETDAQAIARVITDPEAGDVVVMSDNAKEYIYDGTTWSEVGDEAEFVKKTTTIAGVDLQDNITASELRTALNVADGAQVNVVETVKVNGSALTPDANKAVNVTVAEGATNGTVAVNGTDVAVHGLGSAAYTASTAYEAAGSIATAIGALDATETQTAGTDGLALSITEVDGVITAISGSIASNTYASAAQGTLADTALQPEDIAPIDSADIAALFSSGE